jgi:uncharacterized protein
MRLDLERIPTGQSDLDVTGRFDLDFGTAGPAAVQVAGSLRVDNLEGRCILRGELAAQGLVACGRCLQDYTLEFAVPVELVILRDTGHEDDDSDTPVVHQRDGVVDLSESVREAVVLAVPQMRVCREDCRGLCVQCGADLNQGDCGCTDDDVDPRWDGLPG